eukprot:1521480-Rhodomonas_salina.1
MAVRKEPSTSRACHWPGPCQCGDPIRPTGMARHRDWQLRVPGARRPPACGGEAASHWQARAIRQQLELQVETRAPAAA